MIFGRPHGFHAGHSLLVDNGAVTQAQRSGRIRKFCDDLCTGIRIQQTVNLDLKGNAGNRTGTDDLLFAGHEQGIEIICLQTGNDLGGLDVLGLQRSIPLEDLRMLRLVERQLTGEPCVNIAADQQSRGGRGTIFPLQFCQRRRFAPLEGLKLRGAHIGHIHFRRVIILRSDNRKGHYSTSPVSGSTVKFSGELSCCTSAAFSVSCCISAAAAASLRFWAQAAHRGTP